MAWATWSARSCARSAITRLYDDPVRLLRMLRFKVRLGFTIEERTKMQYDNAREAQLETRIAPEDLLEELRHIANEPNCADVVKLLEEEKLLHLFSPDLAGAKLNHAGLQKLQKARQMVPFGIDIHLESMGLFLYFLTRETAGQGRGRIYQEHRSEQAGNGPVAEAGSESQEAGKGSEVGEAAEAVEGLSGAFRRAGRSDAVPAGAFLGAAGARSHQELPGEIFAYRAGGHRARRAGDGRQNRARRSSRRRAKN